MLHHGVEGSQRSRSRSRRSSRQRAAEATSLVGSGVFRDHATGPTSLDYKKAAVLRYKFRIPAPDGNGKHRQPPNWVGHHPMNRDKTRLSADRCEELLESIIGQFDPDEADHDCVSVEQSKDKTHITEWTQTTCDPQPTMSDVVPHLLRDGSVGHTHLNQCLANVLGKAQVMRPGLKKYTDSSGRLSLVLVKAADPELGEYCVRGLSWERLSSQIEVEEPDGIILIQSLLNRKRDMQMVEHELQVLSRLANIVLEFSKRTGSQISVQMAREKLANEGMAQVAHSVEFPGLLNAVLQWGGAESIHFKNLKKFHEVCVNAKLRRLRLSMFIALGQMGVEFPLARNLCAMYAYSASAEQNQIEDGFCNKIKVSQIIVLCKPACKFALTHIEQRLHVFHVEYQNAGVYTGMSQLNLTKLMCKVNLMMATSLLGELKMDACIKLIDMSATKVETALRASLTDKGRAAMDKFFPKHRASEASIPSAPKRADALAPIVIIYDKNGYALNDQDTMKQDVSAVEVLDVPFWTSLESNADFTQKVRFLTAMSLAHEDVGQRTVNDVLVQTQRKGGNEHSLGCAKGDAKVTSVVAKRDLLKGELCLLPLVKGIEFMVSSKMPASPLCVETSLQSKEGNPFFILPCVNWHEKQRFLPPFWLVRRSRDLAEENAEISAVGFSFLGQCKVARASEPPEDEAGDNERKEDRTMRLYEVKIPIMRLKKDIQIGTEIVCYVKQSQKQEKQTKSKTWLEFEKCKQRQATR